nr:protein HIRA-like isoform X2 [Physcomitrium patens]|eukprot:XP_024398569.1 protein HIRA-like isoform X2 [Physcomitrella patens]
MVKKVEGPWEKTVGSTFFRRLGWSPCGHFIATTHGFQNPSHTAPVLERGEWMASFDFVGHNAPVVAVRFNHSMFRKVKKTSVDGTVDGVGNGAASWGGANGTSSKTKELAPYNVIAIGSQDCCISVWTTGSPRPVFIGKHFFQQSVVDLSWSPDGYTLFCCSLDGSVASFQFERKELGEKISDAEMEEFKKSRYGDLRVRQATVAESPAQLMLEAAAAKQWGSGNAPNRDNTDSTKAVPKVANGTVDAEMPKKVPTKPPPAPSTEAHTKVLTKPLPAPVLGIDGRNGSLVPSVSPPVAPSSVKQTEYRRADGRRRIIPEPLGPPRGEDGFGNGALHSSVKYDSFTTTADVRKEDLGGIANIAPETASKRRLPEDYIKPDVPPAKRSNGIALDEALAPAARSSSAAVVAIGLGSERPSNIAGGSQLDMVVPVERMTTPEGVLSIRIRMPEGVSGEDSKVQAPICLEARPAECTNNLGSALGSAAPTSIRESSAKAKIICSQDGEVRWCDYLVSMPTALSGNSNFWAVACGDGSLQIYTMAGRRAQPSIMLGSAAAFMDCDENWKLMVVTRNGLLHLWDLQESKRLLHESLGPLLNSTSANSTLASNGTMKLVSARLSKAGAPLIVLVNRHAFIFNIGMCCWLRVADDSFPASNFVSTWPDADNGELANLQAGVARAAGPSFLWNRMSLSEEKWQTRVHLEVQMSSALALKSASEYSRCLVAYVRCLTKESDEARLRELCEELLGPVGPVGKLQSWKPDILGLSKRELLKEFVLPAMAANRAIQRLLNEFIDLVTECEAAEKASQSGGSIL